MPSADLLVCLGPPNTVAGHYHVALVSPGGDVRLEHASRDLLEVPAAREDITGEALAAILELLACPPLCCNLEHPSRRLERAARVQRQAPYHRPARAPRVDADASALPPWRFPPFPLSLDPGTHRPPPLSAYMTVRCGRAPAPPLCLTYIASGM